jgi:hypothetical protein
VRRAELQRRWVHQAHGRDPDDPDLVMQDVARDLEKMVAHLTAVAEAQGIDLDAPLPPAPIVLDAVRLRRAGLDLVSAIHQLPEGALGPEDHGELMSTVIVLAPKVARIALSFDDDDRGDLWEFDTVPNLLLIDFLRQQVRDGLARVTPGAADAARRALAELDRILDPMIAAIGQPRSVLAGLVEHGAAPSPFCIAPE